MLVYIHRLEGRERLSSPVVAVGCRDFKVGLSASRGRVFKDSYSKENEVNEVR